MSKEEHEWIQTFQNPIYEEIKIRFCKRCGKMEVYEHRDGLMGLQWWNIPKLKEYLKLEGEHKRYAEKLRQRRFKEVEEKIKEERERKTALKYLLKREKLAS